jgi:2-keto-3-deoxy-L-rhamnonate aldolase RhmA
VANTSSFLEKLRNSKSLLAPLISIKDSSVSEMISFLYPDFLIVDMEHSVIGVSDLQDIMMAAKPMEVLARIRGLEKNEIKKVLDTGVSGIIIPGIETAKEVADAVAFSKIAPRGLRGVGPGRASRYGYGFREYLKDANTPLVIIQIETRRAYENLTDVLSVSGLDGCFIGPVDLSTSLGIELSWENKEFVSAVDRILQESRKRNLVTGIYTPLANMDPTAILSRGFNYIMLGADREAIQIEYSNALKSIRKMASSLM